MYKAIIIYKSDELIHRDRSDGYCFGSETDAREWADDYSLDRIAQMEAEGFEVDTVQIEVIKQ